MKRRVLLLFVCLFAAAGCSRGSVMNVPINSGEFTPHPTGGPTPRIIESGQKGAWRYFVYAGAPATQQFGITVGTNQTMWITDYSSELIHVTMKAKMTLFVPLTGSF